MRFAERFLLLLALIGFLLRISGSPQGAAMQLVSFPPLALFYLLFTPSLLNAPWREHYGRPAPVLRIVLSIFAGIVLAYCIISTLMAGLGSFPRHYAMESCGLACVLFALSALFLRDRELKPFRTALLIRGIGVCGTLALAGLVESAVMPGIPEMFHVLCAIMSIKITSV